MSVSVVQNVMWWHPNSSTLVQTSTTHEGREKKVFFWNPCPVDELPKILQMERWTKRLRLSVTHSTANWYSVCLVPTGHLKPKVQTYTPMLRQLLKRACTPKKLEEYSSVRPDGWWKATPKVVECLNWWKVLFFRIFVFTTFCIVKWKPTN